MNLLILRDIVWDHNRNSIMQFEVNQTKNWAARGKLLIFFLYFSKMATHQMDLLILRDILWDQHTNSLIPFGVNRTKNVVARTKTSLMRHFVPLKG